MPATLANRLASLSQPQRDRLAFIELRLRFVGELKRQDLVDRFGVQTAAATRDMALYRELAPRNAVYDASSKRYVLPAGFKPLFDYPAERVLTWLTQSFGDGEPAPLKAWVACEIPSRITQSALYNVAAVTLAIFQQCPLRMVYHSISSGRTEREVVPFALVDTGLRSHVCAFDRKKQESRDFVITGIEQPTLLHDSPLAEHEQPAQDIQWTRIIEVELVPHPDQPHSRITEVGYGLVKGQLKLRLRAATAGYMLLKWGVDCSVEHSLRRPDCRLWLKDHLTLYGVENAVLAPGYKNS